MPPGHTMHENSAHLAAPLCGIYNGTSGGFNLTRDEKQHQPPKHLLVCVLFSLVPAVTDERPTNKQIKICAWMFNYGFQFDTLSEKIVDSSKISQSNNTVNCSAKM